MFKKYILVGFERAWLLYGKGTTVPGVGRRLALRVEEARSSACKREVWFSHGEESEIRAYHGSSAGKWLAVPHPRPRTFCPSLREFLGNSRVIPKMITFDPQSR